MRQLILLYVTMVALLLLGCSPISLSDRTAPPSQTNSDTASVTLPDDLLQQVKAFLSQETGIAEVQIQLQAAEATEWSDACLGVAQPDQLCAQVITPGYRMALVTPQGEYVVHSDRAGSSMRIAQSP